MTSYLLDCDPGVDDALALGYLLGSPGLDLAAVTTVFGNVRVELATDNALRLLHLAGRDDVPVSAGAASPLVAPFNPDRASVVHHANGLGGVELPLPAHGPTGEPAWETIARLSAERSDLHILAIGPLTNLALALRHDPGIVDRVAHVTIMGGAALAPGNATPAAEANVWHDPEAARAVLTADWDTTVVPLDATMLQVLEEPERARLLESGSAYARAMGEILGHYSRFYARSLGRVAAALHDPLAAAVAVGDIPLAVAPRASVDVDTANGPSHGATVFDLRRSRYLGWPDDPDARCRVVLDAGTDFGPQLVDRLTRV
jgi:Inosine-uridine nucleoside N-ribohydrolase